MSQDSVRDLESKYVVQTYRRTPIVLVRGKGVRVFDQKGASISTCWRASASARSVTATKGWRTRLPSRPAR